MNTVAAKCGANLSLKSRLFATTAAVAGCALLLTLLSAQSALAQSTSAAVAQPVAYADRYIQQDTINRKIYAGIGFGMSWLEPDTSEVDGVDPNKRVNPAGQIMLGFDINKWLAIEGHAASLGEAGLSPSGTIGYQTFGVSGLAYAGKNRARYNRRGLSGFGRLGYGYLKNEPSAELPFRQLNESHLLVGAGVEYANRNGLAIRAEAIAFDTDVRFGQLSLLYRVGKRRESRRDMLVQAPPPKAVPITARPIIAPVPAVAVTPIDSDADGIQDSGDYCPGSLAGVAVDELGCALFTGVIEGVKFNSGSAELTADAQGILGGVVARLSRFPAVKLTIMAHTDSQGDEAANKQLSKHRARSVAVYLVQNGVSANRLKAYGFGEEKPIDTNQTAHGRSRNRRVEFQAIR